MVSKLLDISLVSPAEAASLPLDRPLHSPLSLGTENQQNPCIREVREKS